MMENPTYTRHENHDSLPLSPFHPFEDKIIRTGFIRKVYTLLSLQLVFTFMSCLFVNLYEPAQNFMLSETGIALYGLSLAGIIILMVVLCCNPNCLKKYPQNYIYLSLFTIFMTYLLAIATARYNTKSLILAIGITLAITISLTIFACQTKYDFTGYGPYLLSFLWALILIGLINCFLANSVLMTIQAGLGAIVFSFYIIYDSQLIVGGKHKQYEFSIDDYVLATLSLYLDIINLFVYILQLLNECNDSQ